MMTAAAGRSLSVHCKPWEQAELQATPGAALRKGEVHAWFTTLHALRERIEVYASVLDEAERLRADRFRFATDRERFVIGHGLLRQLLSRYLDIAPAAVTMARGRFGKPYIPDSSLRFNLSDTKDAVLIAFTRDHEIGADIETMQRTVDHTAVSEHFFTPEEVMFIHDAGATDAGKRRFLELWTRKEAVLKASGVGIMEDLRVLRVDAPRNDNWITHPEFVRMAAPEYHMSGFRVEQDHLISLATPAAVDTYHLTAVT